MKYDDEIQAGRETDTFIHLRIFELNDEAPPYSTDQKTAEWLANHYNFTVKPVYTLKETMRPEEITEEALGEPHGYIVIARLELLKPDGTRSLDTYMMSSAATYPLCVSRSALLLNQLVKTAWAKPDVSDALLPQL